jgi:hypothetical protein
MKRIDDLFHVHKGQSSLFREYDPGRVIYVTNSSDANGVLGFVEPLDTDKVFDFTGIVVSSFSRMSNSCGARVQRPPFVACSRSGNGLLVLEPKELMPVEQLAYIAAYINRAHGWRFTWYRQATKDRLASLDVPDKGTDIAFPLRRILPKRSEATPREVSLHFRLVRLNSLFSFKAGEYHAESDLEPGFIPLVSCGDESNGTLGHYSVPAGNVHTHKLTIAFNGRPLTTHYHPYRFGAKDDVAVATPRQPMRITTLFFVQMILNRERWRYSYYRKCFMGKLSRLDINFPYAGDLLDEDGMEACILAHPYWPYLENRLRVRHSADEQPIT